MLNKIILILVFIISSNSHALSIGEIISPNENYLNCEDLNWYEVAICNDALAQLNEKIQQENPVLNSNLEITSQGDLLFYKDSFVTPKKLNTGHSCTHRSWIRSSYIESTLKSNASMDLSIQSLSQPLVFYTSITDTKLCQS